MEKEEMVFEIDGREIAERVMEKRLESYREKMLKVQIKVQQILKNKVTYVFTSEGDYRLFIHRNDYDYVYIDGNLKSEDGRHFGIPELYNNIIDEFTKLKLGVYNAPMVERCIVDLLKENETEDIYIVDGTLYYGDLEFLLKDIKEFHVYNDEECIMRIYDELDGWYLIDFDNGIIEEESIL